MASFRASASERRPRALARRAAAAVAAAALSACGTAWVSRPVSGLKAPARESGCTVEFLQQQPQRSYEKLGNLYSYYSTVIDVRDALRAKACELGADAVIVTQDVVVVGGRRGGEGKLVAGTAIRYVDAKRPGDRSGADSPPREPCSPGSLLSLAAAGSSTAGGGGATGR